MTAEVSWPKWTEVGCKWIELARAQHWTTLVPAGPTSGPLPVQCTSPWGASPNEVDRKWTRSGPEVDPKWTRTNHTDFCARAKQTTLPVTEMQLLRLLPSLVLFPERDRNLVRTSKLPKSPPTLSAASTAGRWNAPPAEPGLAADRLGDLGFWREPFPA